MFQMMKPVRNQPIPVPRLFSECRGRSGVVAHTCQSEPPHLLQDLVTLCRVPPLQLWPQLLLHDVEAFEDQGQSQGGVRDLVEDWVFGLEVVGLRLLG